jgi:HEAT repeat protein
MAVDPKRSRKDHVARLRDERDPEVLATFTSHRAWQVRLEAIESLGKTGSPAAEPFLLQVLATSNDQYDLAFASSALCRVGSKAAIPALTGLVHHPVEDVKCSAIGALGVLGDSSLTPTYLDALSHRSWAAKTYAMKAIHQNGDERAIGPVVDRVHAILGRERTRIVLPWSEIMYALDYLRRLESADPRPKQAIEWVRSKRLGRLQTDERRWFESTFGS